ncbi:MAG: hypothetical protein ACRD1E_08725 [Terriglobales bacterium]
MTMTTLKNAALAVLLCTLMLAPAAFATDGVVLINQATALNGLPGCGSTGFPIVICQPGSYRLAGNLTVSGPEVGISITAGHVTLDLNGFAIIGPKLLLASGVFSNQSWTTVENGQVSGFAFGIFLGANANVVRNIAADSNDTGIAAFSGLIVDSSADGNRTVGIATTLNYGDLAVVNCREASSHTGIAIGGGEVIGSEVHNNQTGILVQSGHLSLSNNSIVDNAVAAVEFDLCCAGTVGYGGNVFQNDGAYVSGGNAVSMHNNVCGLTNC